jgi:Suppressor of fused protein (SUFU)
MRIVAVNLTPLALIIALALCASCSKSGNIAKVKKDFSDAEFSRYSEAKQKALEKVLGPMHNMVGHAIIPFQVGGAVDMYYFPSRITGTGFATMELIDPDGTGPKPNRIGTYELVAFTKLKMPPQDTKRDGKDPFNKIERRMCGILTMVGRYSYDAVLNPGETCELPWKEGEPTNCLILDEYQGNGVSFVIDGKKHCLLLCMEVFRSEMEYAMKNGGAPVLRKLKEKGYYPYSDLEREPVF